MGPLFERPHVHSTVAEMLRMLENRELHIAIEKEFALSQACDAHYFAENAKPLGRVIMVP